jgi:AcrR family transcriptional regulator
MGPRPASVGAADRDRILGATAELCAERGYEELELEDIAARAEVPVEGLKELFPDKEAAAGAAIDAVLATVVDIIGRLYSPDRSEAESYLVAIEAILRLMAERPAGAQIAYIGCRQMMTPRLKEVQESGVQLLAAMLERLWDYSTGGAQPPRAARAALGGAEAVVRREVALGRTADLPRLLPDLIYGATVPFLGQAEALRLARTTRSRQGEDPSP